MGWFFKKNKKENKLLLNAIIDICNKESIKSNRLNSKHLGEVFYDFSQEVTQYKLVNEEDLYDLLRTLYDAKVNEVVKYKEVLIERKKNKI
tara:strand:+ start:11383 stop:11655 length:273 start_codon:yes stop_codon:yes gene_type:complete